MAKLLHFFLDVDMRCNHNGLLEILKQKKIKITENDFVVFVNRHKKMLKMLCKGKQALLHYRSDSPIDLGVIRFLPQFCDGKEINIDGALKKHLTEVFERKGYKVKNHEPELEKPNPKTTILRKKNHNDKQPELFKG